MKLTSIIGFVYVVKCGDHYKIGSSTDPQQRLRALQTAQPEAVTLVHTIESARYKYIERDLHRRFAGKRARGEWFALSDDDLAYIRGLSSDGYNSETEAKERRYWDRVILATIAEMKYRRLGRFRDIPISAYVPKVEYF